MRISGKMPFTKYDLKNKVCHENSQNGETIDLYALCGYGDDGDQTSMSNNQSNDYEATPMFVCNMAVSI